MQTRVSIHIDRPVHDVFEFISDFGNTAKWQTGVVSAQTVGDVRIGVGARIRMTSSYQGRSGESEIEVTEFAPDERVSFRTTSPVRGRGSYAVRPENGGTRLSVSGSAELEGVASLAGGIAEHMIEREMNKSLERLKAILERGASRER